jgi:hypothetical protein
MATDVGAILAALATGSQAGGNTGTGGNDNGINRVVGITLRLIADPGNAAAVKELTNQVSGAARNAFREMEELRGKVRSAGGEWAASVGDALHSRLQRRASDPPYAADRVAAKLQEMHAGREHSPTGRHGSQRSGTSHPTRAGGASSSRKDEVEGSRSEQIEKGADELGEVGSHLVGLAKRLYVLSAPDDKIAEERKKKFEAVENIYEVAEDSWKIAKGARNFIQSFSSPAAQQQGPRLLRATTKSGRAALGALTAEEGFAGAGRGLAAETLTGTSLAGAAGTGALFLAAGIAVHDVLGKLTGKFETLSGAVGDWIATTNRNVELEKTIERQLQAQANGREFQRQQVEAYRSFYEGRERIEEAQRFQFEIVPGYAC